MKKIMSAVLCLVIAAAISGCANDSVSIGIIGGADGPTEIFVSGNKESPVSNGDPLTAAPELTVGADGQTVTATHGTTSWSYRVKGDNWSGYEADCIHPLDESGREITPTLYFDPRSASDGMTPVKAGLLFDSAPDSVTVRGWDEKYMGNPQDDGRAELLSFSASDFSVELKDGSCIYEVTAEWNSSPDYYGTARYVFYAAPAGTEK